MLPSSMNDLFQFLSDLLTTHAGTFQALGLNLFRGLALILIVWFGAKSALSSASGGPGFRMDHFAQLLLTIAFGFAMITYYTQPIPGFGVSFHSLITNEGLGLANQLNNGIVSDLFSRLDSMYFSLEVPVIAYDIIAILHFVLIVAMIILLEAAVFFVIAFGYIAAAIAVLLGPVFIPFFIVPKMEWLFWGWFKAFLQYSFYPVVANAYLYVFGSMLVHLLDSHPPPYDSAAIALLFAPLLFLLIAFVYGVVKIPSLVSSLFSGSSGESVVPRIS
jgi:type IV secretory pathway VirB6-like protein